MSESSIGWGILGTGRIARLFASDLSLVSGSHLAAIGSRTVESATAFAPAPGDPARHAGYQALVDDPSVDVVYVATPHPWHREGCLLALRAGKAVLCEKPFCMDAAQATEVIDEARRRDQFVMEAMWTRFFPALGVARDWLSEGRIGEPRMLTASFGFRAPNDPHDRLLNRALGGGALLDVGVYPVSLASWLFGEPDEVAALGSIGPTGVDEQSGYLLRHAEGQLAVLSSAVRTETAQDAIIYGAEGSIRIHAPFWRPTRVSLTISGESEAGSRSSVPLAKMARTVLRALDGTGAAGARLQGWIRDLGARYREQRNIDTHSFAVPGYGMHYEAAEVGRLVRLGAGESDVMPLGESLAIMRTLDRLRAELGLSYS